MMNSRSNLSSLLVLTATYAALILTSDGVLPPTAVRPATAFTTTAATTRRTIDHAIRRPLIVLRQSSNIKILENDLTVASSSSSSSSSSSLDVDTAGPNFKDYLPTTTATATNTVAAAAADTSAAAGEDALDEEYKKGFAIIGFITLLNASLAPVWHTVFDGANTPPPLFLNAVVSIVAFTGLLLGSPFLDSKVETTSALASSSDNDEGGGAQKWSANSFRGGMELGLWKGLGTTCHIYGMALTTANHGAFLLQLTTLIVPVLQGIRGERIPMQIQLAVGLALGGIVAFTQDPSGAAGASAVALDPAQVQLGDTLVLGAAFFYSLYDIQTFYWGREVPRTELVTIKVGFQAFLSVVLCAVVARDDVVQYLADGPDYGVMVPTVLWSGLIVNALATFLQVGGMQSVGPTRAQTIFASQPLWASILNFVFIGEMMGTQGLLGGGAFLGALFLAATAEAPKPVRTNTSAQTVP